jgi:hypothetical protein
VAVIAADPDEAAFARLRGESDHLWAISPRLYRWRAGKAAESGSASLALEIFSRYHHMTVLPAVVVDRLPQKQEWERFSEQLLQWAEPPHVAGLNLVIEHLRPEDLAPLEALQRTVGERGKLLAVTVGSRAPEIPADSGFAWFTSAGAESASFQLAGEPKRRDPG